MTLHLLVPTAVTPIGGAAALTPGPSGGTVVGVLTDGDSATWARAMTSYAAQHMALSTFTIPANEYVACCDLRIQANNYTPSLGSHDLVQFASGGPTTTTKSAATKVTVTNTIATWTSPRAATPAAAGLVTSSNRRAWTQTDIDNLALIVTPVMASGNRVYLREVSAGIGALTKPIAAVSAANTDATRPLITVGHLDRWAATVTNKARTSNVATITTSAAHGFLAGNTVVVSGVDDTFDGTWTIATVTSSTFTYSCTASNVSSTSTSGTAEIGDSKQHTSFRLRVFTPAQYGAPGFDPATSAATWSSEEVYAGSSVDLTRGIGVDLDDGTYRVYAQTLVRDHVYLSGASVVWTDWVYASFTVAVTPAAPAALTAAWNATTQAVDLAVTTRGNVIPPAYCSAESIVGSWATSACSVARVADTGITGSWVTELTASGGSPATITMPYTATSGVIGGERYLLKIPLKAVTETRSVTATITWRDDAGTGQGTATTGAVSPTTGNGWSLYLTTNVVAPAGATKFDLAITVAGPPAAAAKWRFDGLMLVLATGVSDDAASLGYGQGGPGAGLSAFRTLVEASPDGGVTWSQVRAPEGTDQTVNGIAGQRWVGADYEAPRGLTMAYRASLVAEAPAQVVSTSGATPVATTSDGGWWAKAVSDPTLNCGSIALLADPSFQVEEGLTVHRPIGRTYPVVVAGTVGGNDGSGVILTRSAAEHEDVELLLRHQGVILFQAPFTTASGIGLQVWARVTSRAWPLQGTAAQPRRPIAIDWVDVGRPEVGA